MRLPFKEDDDFSMDVNSMFEDIKSSYCRAIKPQLSARKVNVMLGDGTIIASDTFEIQKVMILYQRLINSLKGWVTTGISRSNTDDLHRLYCQFINEEGKYYLYGYFGIQFHAVPYYKIDNRVIEIQRELAHDSDRATKTFQLIAGKGNDIIHKELQEVGCSEMEFEELFVKLFENKELFERLEGKALSVENEFPEFEKIHIKRNQLFTELNSFIIELYQISAELMDYNKLLQGQIGVVTYFDIEKIKNLKTKERESYINTKSITKESKNQILSKFNGIARTLREMAADEEAT
jgi:hypothetical protein